MAEIVAEIDQPVARREALGEAVMQPAQALRLAVDRGDRPDAARPHKTA